MNSSLNLNTATRFVGSSLSRSYLWCGLFLIAVVLACFGLSPRVQAVTPVPDGGYPGNNTAEGDGALLHLTTGVDNTALGFQALLNDTDGRDNTGTGFDALADNTHGSGNTATGIVALLFNTTGLFNTATGFQALAANSTGHDNTATGAGALEHNNGVDNTATGDGALGGPAGFDNTATGVGALGGNTTGSANAATGVAALENNTTGSDNTATGFEALEGVLFSNGTGGFNMAEGWQALASNVSSFSNVATGFQALFSTTSGTGENTANGSQALQNNTTGGGNTASGFQALFSNNGNFNIALGYQAGSNLTTGSSNIDIGNLGVGGIPGESSTIRIGTPGTQTKAFMAGVFGVAEGGTVSVVTINSNGQLGTQVPVVSSQRFKKDIKPMDKASEAILAFKPVTFELKEDSKGTPQFGLIAEDVAKVNPDLVVRDDKGEIYSVRYEAVNAMLLNEFLKEHRTAQEQGRKLQERARKLQEQEATIAQLKAAAARQEAADAEELKAMEAITARLKEQDSKIQKVSDQIELSKPATQTVFNQQ